MKSQKYERLDDDDDDSGRRRGSEADTGSRSPTVRGLRLVSSGRGFNVRLPAVHQVAAFDVDSDYLPALVNAKLMFTHSTSGHICNPVSHEHGRSYDQVERTLRLAAAELFIPTNGAT